MRVPGAPANGRVCREIVEFVDLVPTLGELARLDLPGNLEGASFVPLLVNPERPWKKAMFMVEDDSESGQVVRTRKYSYLEFKKGERPAALFDLEKDRLGKPSIWWTSRLTLPCAVKWLSCSTQAGKPPCRRE